MADNKTKHFKFCYNRKKQHLENIAFSGVNKFRKSYAFDFHGFLERFKNKMIFSDLNLFENEKRLHQIKNSLRIIIANLCLDFYEKIKTRLLGD